MPAELHIEGRDEWHTPPRQDLPPHNWNQRRQAANPISDACQIQILQSCQRLQKFSYIVILHSTPYQPCYMWFKSEDMAGSVTINRIFCAVSICDLCGGEDNTNHFLPHMFICYSGSAVHINYMHAKFQVPSQHIKLIRPYKVHSGSHYICKWTQMSFNHTCPSVEMAQDRVLVVSWQFEKAFVPQWQPRQSWFAASEGSIITHTHTSTHLRESLRYHRWWADKRLDYLPLFSRTSSSSTFFSQFKKC